MLNGEIGINERTLMFALKGSSCDLLYSLEGLHYHKMKDLQKKL